MWLGSVLRFPLWLVRLFIKKPRKRKFSKLDRKVWKHSWNFAPGRLKNISWQKGLGKPKKKRNSKANLRKKTKKVSNK